MLVHEQIVAAAGRDPQAKALHYPGADLVHGALACRVSALADGLRLPGAQQHDPSRAQGRLQASAGSAQRFLAPSPQLCGVAQ